uniref:Uncharacterized protein n=1 Tax=Heterorhabditis bacteriophora TaxID=37862 RepID=A0A1I7WYB0_HETBA
MFYSSSSFIKKKERKLRGFRNSGLVKSLFFSFFVVNFDTYTS